MAREKTDRPKSEPLEQRNYYDLEGRRFFAPSKGISKSMLAIEVQQAGSTEYGHYGRNLYGRCVYAPNPRGIYGTDTYGNCLYW